MVIDILLGLPGHTLVLSKVVGDVVTSSESQSSSFYTPFNLSGQNVIVGTIAFNPVRQLQVITALVLAYRAFITTTESTYAGASAGTDC